MTLSISCSNLMEPSERSKRSHAIEEEVIEPAKRRNIDTYAQFFARPSSTESVFSDGASSLAPAADIVISRRHKRAASEARLLSQYDIFPHKRRVAIPSQLVEAGSIQEAVPLEKQLSPRCQVEPTGQELVLYKPPPLPAGLEAARAMYDAAVVAALQIQVYGGSRGVVRREAEDVSDVEENDVKIVSGGDMELD